MTLTQYTWNPLHDSVLEEIDGLGDVQATYTNKSLPFGPLVSQNRIGSTSYFHFDGLGSTRLLTNTTGDVTDVLAADAWGNSVNRTGTTETPFVWGGSWGYQFDISVAAYYVRARIYRPTIARLMSIDPLLLTRHFIHAQGVHGYVFADNRPNLSSDPSGLITVEASAKSWKKLRTCAEDAGGNIQFCEAGFKFTLDGPANAKNWKGYPFHGYFIQKVTVYCEVRECYQPIFGCPITSTDMTHTVTYYEAFDVGANETTYILNPTDRIKEPVIPETCGNRIQLGEIRFFSVVDTGFLDEVAVWGREKEFIAGPRCSADSGGMLATQSEPQWWRDNKQKEGPAFRWTSLNYNCCCGPDMINFRGDPEVS